MLSVGAAAFSCRSLATPSNSADSGLASGHCHRPSILASRASERFAREGPRRLIRDDVLAAKMGRAARSGGHQQPPRVALTNPATPRDEDRMDLVAPARKNVLQIKPGSAETISEIQPPAVAPYASSPHARDTGTHRTTSARLNPLVFESSRRRCNRARRKNVSSFYLAYYADRISTYVCARSRESRRSNR